MQGFSVLNLKMISDLLLHITI